MAATSFCLASGGAGRTEDDKTIIYITDTLAGGGCKVVASLLDVVAGAAKTQKELIAENLFNYVCNYRFDPFHPSHVHVE